jgi:hypothetical protein
LQRSFEETLQNILQYINKWTAEENNKLALAVGFFITSQLASVSVLKVLFKDYLVKDGKATNEFEMSITVFSTNIFFSSPAPFCLASSRPFAAVCYCYFQDHVG